MNILLHPWTSLFFIGFIAYLTIRGYFARGTRHNQKIHRQVDGLEKFLLVLVIATSTLLPLLYLFTPLLAFADYRLPAWVPWIGAAVMLAALWLFWRSHADLGQNWSVTLELRQDHELVTAGVYRAIRHPMYAAIFLWCLAQALLLPNWLAGWSALATFTLMYVLRTPREERMLCEFFGQRYRDYMGQTGRLLPRIIETAVRSIFAVLAGIVATTAVAFAIEVPLRWLTLRLLSQTFPNQAALDSNVGWMLSQSLYTVPALVLGGYVAAWLAPHRGLAHAVAMAIVQDLLIVSLIFNPPHPVPPWIWAIGLIVTPAAIIFGGYLCSRSRAAPQPAAPSERPGDGMRKGGPPCAGRVKLAR